MSKVSVLMPTLNMKSYIEEAVESILRQTFSNFELIIVDGGSTDGTFDFCQKIEDDRVKVFEEEPGLTPQRRKTVNQAKGKYVAIADSDTFSYPTRLEKQVQYLDEHPNIGTVGSYVKRVDVKTGTEWIDKRSTEHEKICKEMIMHNSMIHPTLMIRRKLFNKIGNYRDYHWEDYELMTRLMDFKMANIDKVLVKYYIRERGHTSKTSIFKGEIASLICGLLAIIRGDLSMFEKFLWFPWRIAIGIKNLLIGLRKKEFF